MEDEVNAPLQGTNNNSNDSTLKTSRSHIVEYDSDSAQATRSKSPTKNITRDLDIVELSSDDEVQIIDFKEEKVEKTPEHGPGQKSSGRASPKDTTCTVCLSEYDNKAFVDKCFHAFCYFCILQWSEIVRTCPLCKSSFSSIIHSVKSIDNYQQHYLSKPDAPITQQSQSDGRRFRYRTTLIDGNRQQQRQQQQANERDPWGQRARRRHAHNAVQRDRKAIARERRRTIYSNNLWVRGVTQEGRLRQREISPEFYRVNPACTHRLIPWLIRDLRVLLNDVESHVDFVLQIILSLITKSKVVRIFKPLLKPGTWDIPEHYKTWITEKLNSSALIVKYGEAVPRVELNSEVFYSQLQPFLFDQTEHFIHEFISFARSPFDVTAYDERALYNWDNESRDQARETPTVFHSQTSGWQTPVPGPSGESMLEALQTDWDRDSPVLVWENTGWSPSTAPSTSGLNGLLTSAEIVTVSLDSPHTVSTKVECSDSDEPANAPSHSKGPRNRSRSTNEAMTLEDSRGKHKHSEHCRRHSHKHKHKNKRKHKPKDSKRHKTKPNTSEQCLDNDLEQEDGSKSISIHSSVSRSPPVEVIVVSSDSNASPVSSRASRIDLRMSQRKTNRPASQSRSRSRSVPKGKRIVQGEKCRSRSGCTESHSSRDRSRTTEERPRQDNHRSRLRSRSRSRSHIKEKYRSKRERRSEIDERDLSNSDLVCSRRKSLKKEKSHRKKRRSRTRSRSHSRSNIKSASKTCPQEFDKRTKVYSRSRSTSESSMSYDAPSSSRNSRSRRPRSRNSQSRNSRSRSRSRLSRLPRNHAGSSCDSRSRKSSQSTVHSESDARESHSYSNEDIKKEIEDLGFRITADKKRLLKLLIKQERAKAVDVIDLSEITDNEPGVGNDCQDESN